MSESSHPEDVTAQNKRSLSTLMRAITRSQGRFSLILVRCNYTSVREYILAELRRGKLQIREITLEKSTTNLYLTIQTAGLQQPNAVMVLGLESVTALDDLLISLNRVRDDFRQSCSFPLVLWINDLVLQKFVKLAPDFYSYAGVPIHLAIATNELVKFLRQEANELFTKILAAGADQQEYAALNLEMAAGKRFEMESALRDLQNRGDHEAELEASQQFILGRDAYLNNQMERSRLLYEQSLAFWQQGDEAKNGKSKIQHSKSVEYQACLLFHLGMWWRRYAALHRAEHQTACCRALDYYQQCVEILQQAYPQLVAKFINSWAEVLQQLERWDELETVAQASIDLQIKYPHARRLANAYAFLAEVALVKSQWREAKHYAETALQTIGGAKSYLHKISGGVSPDWVQQSHITWYLLLLLRATQHLDEVSEALQNLETAKQQFKIDYNPKLYIRILETLHELYFEQHRYLAAFNLKQEQNSIEQQYGFRAFIGAGRLQSLRQVINPMELGISHPGAIAAEISASDRQRDVERLIERISRNDHKLIVIHGPSGVGKSSLLTAGLIPALHEITAFDGRKPLSVVVRVYTDWVKELNKCLADTLALKQLIVSPHSTDPLEAIVAELRQNINRNLFTVLIFDQFEEFFFNCPHPVQRRKFWEFLHVCLDSLELPYVQVILSLREDYLHYLLECDRLTNLEVTKNDILNKEIRYSVGNFSPADAKHVIQSLTECSFCLESELVDELVRDLAGDLGEVRPIELQVVGAQLQTENITTLVQYQQSGPKEKLVERFLAAIVKDCGSENQRAAELVLYLLTDENNTRPLKTRAEIAADLVAEADKLDLVLEIFVKSGLVLLIPQSPADRYQLVHDYLVSFIRQQRGAEILAELEREKAKRQQAEAHLNQVLKRRLREAYIAGSGLVTLAAISGILGLQSFIGKTNAQLNARNTYSEALIASDNQQDALINSLQVGGQLKRSFGIEPDIEIKVVHTLQQALDSLKARERQTLSGHNDTVYGVSFSPDGKTLASASLDKTIKLWSVDGKLLQTLSGHNDGVHGVSFSPDGKTLASTSADKTIKLWSVDGKLLQTLSGHNNAVYGVSFSPDGKTLASASLDKTIKLWSVDGKLLQTLSGHNDTVYGVSFSPDGKTLASASLDKTIKLWSVDGKLLQTLSGHNDTVYGVSFSPDGKTLASASLDKTIKLWSVDGKLLQTLSGHNDGVHGVSFSPDGKTLASASLDKTIKLWSVDGKLLQTLSGHNNAVYGVSFSPDGKTLASTSADKTIKLWSVDGKLLQTLSGHKSWVIGVSFSSDGKTLASASLDKTIKLWSVDGKLLQTLSGHKSGVIGVSFSPDGKTLASASLDKTIKLWSVDGKLLQTLSGHKSAVIGVSFSPDGKTLASASLDKTIKLWSVDGKLLQTLSGHKSAVIGVSFSPDGKTLASASLDKTIKLWSVDGKLLQTLSGHKSAVIGVSFSPDGKTLASTSLDKTIKLWSVDGKLLQTLSGHKSWVIGVSFSPDSKTLASASLDKTIKLWSVDGKLLQTLSGHKSGVIGVSFSPDGKTLASASSDGTIKLWNLNLESLLSLGCDWLKYYLPQHPETLESLPVCQNKSLLMAAAITLVAQGEELARSGNFDGAVAKFKQAKAWNSQLQFNPEEKAKALGLDFQGKK